MQPAHEKAGDDLKSAGEDAKDTAKNLESGARDKAKDFKAGTKDNAEEAKSEAKGYVQSATDAVKVRLFFLHAFGMATAFVFSACVRHGHCISPTAMQSIVWWS